MRHTMKGKKKAQKTNRYAIFISSHNINLIGMSSFAKLNMTSKIVDFYIALSFLLDYKILKMLIILVLHI